MLVALAGFRDYLGLGFWSSRSKLSKLSKGSFCLGLETGWWRFAGVGLVGVRLLRGMLKSKAC